MADALGQTALHFATSKGHLSIVKFIQKYYKVRPILVSVWFIQYSYLMINLQDDFVKIIFLLDNQEMTAKMISTGKNDPRITNLLDKKGVFLHIYTGRVTRLGSIKFWGLYHNCISLWYSDLNNVPCQNTRFSI